MRALGIVVEPFSFVSVLEVEGIKEINQHGSLRITGIIEQEKENRYRKMAQEELWIRVDVIGETGEPKCFFYGLLTAFYLEKENRLSTLTLEMKTGSYLLDVKLHTRSFQQPQIPYKKLIDTCIKAAGGSFILLEKQEEKTDRWFMQYQETDWAFVKRLASRMGTALIPEDTVPGKKIYLGYRKQLRAEINSWEHYRIEQDFGELQERLAYGMTSARDKDAISYVLSSRELYPLGSTVIFQEREYIVGKVLTRLEGQELYHEYYLITPLRGLQPPFANVALAGTAQPARVTAVQNTMVQVELCEDENKAESGKKWFDYATVYSTPDGTGWYCMPEIGDEVRLVFPGREENYAYVSSSVHLEAGQGRDNPQEKFWKNKQNKEIRFTSDSIILRNNQGLIIELSDKEGIRLTSDKDIVMQAEGDIKMNSQSGGIQMGAASQLLLQQGAAKVQVANDINISGGKIYMN